MIYWKVKNKTYTKFMIDSFNDHSCILSNTDWPLLKSITQ